MTKYFSADQLTNNLTEKLTLLGNVLGVIGNNGIRAHHIKFFEEKILELQEDKTNDICLAPHFYAWLSLCCEHLFWLIREFCFKQHNFQDTSLVNQYNPLIRHFISKCRQLACYTDQEIEDIYKNIEFFLIVRHLYVHGGFPNFLPRSKKDVDKYRRPLPSDCTENNKYNIVEVEKVIGMASRPDNFCLLKKKFYKICDFLSKSPSLSIGF